MKCLGGETLSEERFFSPKPPLSKDVQPALAPGIGYR